VQAVHSFQKDTKRHLNDGEDNSQLHFKVVCVRKKLITFKPHWIETKGIDMSRMTFICANFPDISVSSRVVNDFDFVFIVRLTEDAHRNSEKFIVNAAAEHGEETHHQENISHAE
jgi:hypothetical protein